MSAIPVGWIDVELSEIAQLIRGVTYKREQSADAPQNGFLPVLRATNITGVALTFDALVYVPAANVSAEQILLPGDVVIASSSGSKEIVGKAGSFIGGSFVGSFGAFCTGLRPSGALSPAYFRYYFQTPSYRKSVSELSAGSNINNLKTADLASQNFPLPPAPEQTRIVEKLEELLSDLDAGVAELKAAQKKLGQYRQSLLKAAVEGVLTADWRAARKVGAGETAPETGAQLLERILAERRARWEAKQLAKFAEQGKTPPKDWQKKYPEPVQPDTSDLPELPEGWVWASVEQLAELVSGNTPKDAEACANSGGDIAWFKVGDMNRLGNESWLTKSQICFSRDSALNLGMKIAPPGTIVFPKRGGAIATNKKRRLRSEACFDLNTMGLIPVDSSGEWLWWWFQGIDLGRLSDGSNVPQINNPDIAPLVVPLPPLAEQAYIVECLQTALQGVVEQECAVNISLKQSAAQRKNILKAAFSGQLVPQDPNDEPASVLLERIRAERAKRAVIKKPRRRSPREDA